MVTLSMEQLLSVLNNRNDAHFILPLFRQYFAAAVNKAEFSAIVRGRMIYDKFYEYSDDSRDYNLGTAHDTIMRELKEAGY